MLGRSTLAHDRVDADEDLRPLLSTSENGTAQEIFSVREQDFESSDEEVTGGDTHKSHTRGPTLKSTTTSREVEFELDSDELTYDPSTDLESLTSDGQLRAQRRPISAPLLVGLFDTSHTRQSLEASRRTNNLSPGEDHLDLEELAHKPSAGGSMLDSVANMANSILGAGIIGLPYAIKQAGFFTGIVLLVTLTVVTDWTIRLIVVNAKLSGRNTYIGIMDHCFGKSGRAAVSIFQFAFAFGGMCAFGIIIGDTIPHVVRSLFPQLSSTPILSIFANRQFIIAMCTVCVSYPLSLYRDIHKLSRASGFALIGMLIIVVSVLVERENVTSDLKGNPRERFTIIQPQLPQAIGVISFAFVCHHNSLLIYGSLRTPTIDRFATVTHISTAISLVSCSTLAISAYLVFTDKTKGNVLNNFSPNDTIINIARFCFGLNMFTTLPLELFVCREVIEQYFFSHESFNYQRHLLFTTSILFSSMFLSMITCDLGVMLEITGGVSATALAFIFPAICYIKLSSPQLSWSSRQKLPAVICSIFGLCTLSLSLILALSKVWTTDGGAKICV